MSHPLEGVGIYIPDLTDKIVTALKSDANLALFAEDITGIKDYSFDDEPPRSNIVIMPSFSAEDILINKYDEKIISKFFHFMICRPDVRRVDAGCHKHECTWTILGFRNFRDKHRTVIEWLLEYTICALAGIDYKRDRHIDTGAGFYQDSKAAHIENFRLTYTMNRRMNT